MTDLAGKYRANNHFVLHGKRYAPGSTVTLSHDEAERAIAQGTVEKPKAPEAAPAPHPAERRNAELRSELDTLCREHAILEKKHDVARESVFTLERRLDEESGALKAAQSRIVELEALLAQATAPSTTLTATAVEEPSKDVDPKTPGQPVTPKGNAKRT